jgi:bifunctional DNase/RNase
LTHDLLSSLIDALGGEVESVAINAFKDDTFYGQINLTINGKRFKVDSRPSDAMALAVRVGTPILVEESVLAKVGLCQDDENWKPASSESETTRSPQDRLQAYKPVSKEDLKRMSAYSDFLNTLNLDDLNKRQS